MKNMMSHKNAVRKGYSNFMILSFFQALDRIEVSCHLDITNSGIYSRSYNLTKVKLNLLKTAVAFEC